MRHLLRPSVGRTIALAAAALAVTLATATISNARQPAVAGHAPPGQADRSTATTAASVMRAAALVDRLGLPRGNASLRRFDDPVEHATYDDVTMTDDHGRAVSLVRLAPDGSLTLAARLGLHANGRPVDEAGAVARAQLIARRAGLASSGRAAARASHGTGGWLVTWPRVVDGVPVRGDGLRVGMWSDGTLHSISQSEHPLSNAPVSVADRGRAGSVAQGLVAARFRSAAGSLAALAPTLAWVQPNDTRDASSAAPDPVARLAWVVEYRASGPLADGITALEIWLDAGSLQLVGGDVAE